MIATSRVLRRSDTQLVRNALGASGSDEKQQHYTPYLTAGHCERADCYGTNPAQVESLAAQAREFDGDHQVGASRSAATLMAHGVPGPTRLAASWSGNGRR